MTEKEAEAIRTCITRIRPHGSEQWQGEQAQRLGLGHTLRREGRPRGTGARRRGKNYLRPSFDPQFRPQFASWHGLNEKDTRPLFGVSLGMP
jgi:hypothetical protein